MASTWTCASGHTHDLTKPLRGLEPDATPGKECKSSGDRVSGMDYGSSPVPKKKFTASTRAVADSS
jgi:hypothetical protein